MHRIMWRLGLIALVIMIGLAPAIAQPPSKPYTVTIAGEKDDATERFLPADATARINYQYSGNLELGAVSFDSTRFFNRMQTLFMIDGTVLTPTSGPRLQDLNEATGRQKRHGGTAVWVDRGVRVTMRLEVMPSKPTQSKPGEVVQRRLDTLLIKYTLENLTGAPHKVGCRNVVYNNRFRYGLPTRPKEVLNGELFEKKGVPNFLEVLDQQNQTGNRGIYTLRFNDKLEGPGKVVLTRAGLVNGQGWDIAAEQAGSAVCVLYWESKEIPGHGKREIAFSYGAGIPVLNEGRVSANFTGSFEPGKSFMITAYVDGPVDGQILTLQLPKGMERLDGKATEIVPLPDETGQSVVMWRCRVTQVGTHSIQIRSSNGVTKTWTVSVSAPE